MLAAVSRGLLLEAWARGRVNPYEGGKAVRSQQSSSAEGGGNERSRSLTLMLTMIDNGHWN